MAITKSQLINQRANSVRDLVGNELEATEIAPIVKDKELGKYVFIYDYEVNIFTPEAEQIMAQKGFGVPYSLPKGSSFTLKYSKGDVVDVVDFKKYNNEKGVPVANKKVMLINVPKYVKPIGGVKGFSPTVIVDNSLLTWLQKVPNTTPLTTKLGVNFGANINPKTKPVIDKPVTPTPTDTPTPTPTDTPVIMNGVEDTTETKSFFDDKNNLLMIAGVLLIGYLLFNDKSE
jgi:hypothetical protein